MRFKELELKRMQDELAICECNYNSVNDQLKVEGDAPRQNQLKDQLKKIGQEMKSLEQEIKTLEQEIQQEKTDLKALVGILQHHEGQFNELLKVYQQVLTNWRCQVNPTPQTPKAIITELLRIPKGQSQYNAFEQFIGSLVCLVENVPLLTALQAWGEQHIDNWAGLSEWLGCLQEQQNQQAQPALLIEINPRYTASTQPQEGNRYQVEAWLIQNIEHYRKHRQGYSAIKGSNTTGDETYSLKELLEKAPQLISEWLAECSSTSDKEPEIHVFLPLDLMNQAVDCWLPDDGYGRPERIGQQYKVVIRCVDRLGRSYRNRPRWIKKWERQQALLQETASQLFMGCDDTDLDHLFGSLKDLEAAEAAVIGLKMTQAPCQVGPNSVFSFILQFGFPLAIWGRCNLSETKNEVELDRLLQAACLEKLPDSVRQVRQQCHGKAENCHIGHHLSLLWDDPELVPPKSA